MATAAAMDKQRCKKKIELLLLHRTMVANTKVEFMTCGNLISRLSPFRTIKSYPAWGQNGSNRS